MTETPIEEQPSPNAPALKPRPQDALLSGMKLPLRGVFYPLGYPVAIRTNDPAVLRAARESFGHNRLSRSAAMLELPVGVVFREGASCPPEPVRRQTNHLFLLVADADNQAVLDLKSRTSFTWITQAAAHNASYLRHNFLEKAVYLLLGASVVTDLHAACVSKHDKGVLLFGDSGAGKTTLSYACARAGWTYTSDDTSYLINDSFPPRVIGHSHRARFRPSARNLFPELEGQEVTPRIDGKPSIEVPTADLPVVRTAAETSVDFIVYLRRFDAGCGELVRLPEGTATRRAIEELYSAGDIRARHEEILTVFASVPTFELRYRDLRDAIESLDRLTRGT